MQSLFRHINGVSLCRNSKVAFARHSLNNGALRMQLLKKIEKSVKAEMKAVCTDPRCLEVLEP